MYALWIENQQSSEALSILPIKNRIEKVREFREVSKREGTRKAREIPWAFAEKRFVQAESIVLPVVNSQDRIYLPVSYLEEGIVATNALCIVYNAPIWLIGIISSKMHIEWLKEVGGRLKNDYRYAPGLVYNTFPIPELSDARKNMLEEAVFEMLDVREEEGGTLAELYGGANKPMNDRLRQAHEKIDGIVERAYQQKPFESDEERLSVLLKLYKEMAEKEAK